MKNKENVFGFTLVELLVTIAIIALLVSLATVAVRAATSKAKEAKVLGDVKIIYEAITQLSNDTNLWPGRQTIDSVCLGSACSNNEICGTDMSNNNCLAKFTDDTSGIIATDGNFPGWGGPYMVAIPTDPWGREYFFDTDYSIVDVSGKPCGCGGGICVNAVVIGSYGPDGEAVPIGGAGAYGCDDIIRVIKR